ncbi:MAG: carbon monoxide dehydrogenase subunit G [Anaerolineae bacterium]|nr:carbon monoxide dehydrogenase subunit G [Anaerolineae bacterium]
MQISGEYVFDAPRDRVWLAVRDPDVLGTILPGGQGIEEIGENQYAGKLQIKIGPVQGVFDGKIALSNLVAPQSYDVVVDGKGAPGFVNASGSLLLTEQGDKTHMVYEGTAQVGGRVAAVGQRLLDASAKSMVRQSLDALNVYVQAQQTVACDGSAETDPISEPAARRVEIPGYTPPSQAELAFNVAKDVAADLAPDPYNPWLTLTAVALAAFFLGILIGKRKE